MNSFFKFFFSTLFESLAQFVASIFIFFTALKNFIDKISTDHLYKLQVVLFALVMFYSSIINKKCETLLAKNAAYESQIDILNQKMIVLEQKTHLAERAVIFVAEQHVSTVIAFVSTVIISISGCYAIYQIFPMAGLSTGYAVFRNTADILKASFEESQAKSVHAVNSNVDAVLNAVTDSNVEVAVALSKTDQLLIDILLGSSSSLSAAIGEGFSFTPFL